MYIGCTKFQVILKLKNRVLRKNILVLISHTISFNSSFNSYQQKYKSLAFIPNWLCLKNIDK